MKTEIRKTIATDVAAITEFVRKTGFFRDSEIDIAAEVLNDAVSGRDDSYRSYSCLSGSEVIGWVCFGHTPCTVSTYDIYWIAVSPSAQRGGIGSGLLSFAESAIAGKGGYLTVIETSGADMYIPTQQFYMSNGYKLEATIRDFYDINDHKLVFTKRLDSEGSTWICG